MTTIIAVLTSHNRKLKTLECLARLECAASRAGVALEAVLVDDGSTDGTSAAVATRFPWVSIDRGDGTLFWNRGMHRAQAAALTRNPDFLLWLNDDTALIEDALVRLLATREALFSAHADTIVVGATADADSGELTYGGAVSMSRFRRFTYRKVWSASEAVECETMNGNVVLLPAPIVRAVGNLDPVFEHAMGDTDYALRARRSGFRIFVAPGVVGHCSKNAGEGTHADPSLPVAVRWRKLLSRKGLPMRSWLHFTRRHGGVLWPIYFCWPYARLAAAAFPGQVRLPGRKRSS